jgi:hypothetical protein
MTDANYTLKFACIVLLIPLCGGCATPKPVLDLASQGVATVGLTEAALRNYLALTSAQLGARMDLVRQDEERLASDQSRREFDKLLDESAGVTRNDQSTDLIHSLGDGRRKIREQEAADLQKLEQITTFDVTTLPEVPAEKLNAAKKGFAVLSQELSAKEWIDLAAGYAGEISADIKTLHAGGASDKPK